MLLPSPAKLRYLFGLVLLSGICGFLLFAPLPPKVGAQSVQPAEEKSLREEKTFDATNNLFDFTPNFERTTGIKNVPSAIQASVCLSGGTLSASDLTYNRLLTQSTGTGLQSPCALSSSGSAVRYNTYQFNLTGCAAFPAQVVISGCPGGVGGTGGCAANASTTDTVFYIYRSGGSLTAGTGTVAPFNPTSPCTNVVAANDDLGSVPTVPGGSSCDGATCHPQCGAGLNSNSGLYRSLGPGIFTVVVTGFGNTTTGTFNLFVNAPGAGCVLANTPTATDGTITGTLTDDQGAPIAGAVVNLTGTQNRKFITDANGNYRFDNVETTGFYTVRPSRVDYSFSPAERSFSQIGNQTEAAFTGSPLTGTANPLDTPEYFVRQQYLDFLGREPDESGFNFWSDQMLDCGLDLGCVDQRRINVSAAYFLSIEFQVTGGLVDSLYRASYGRAPRYNEFGPDAAAVGVGVIVGKGEWSEQLAANKQAFLDAWVQRADFRVAYDGLTDNQYVDSLVNHTGVNFSESERAAMVDNLTNGSLTRAGVLKQLAEDSRFISAKRNEMFVMMEYFGYLRRDPDEAGYQFWLNKLNQFDGNFERAEMVKAFLVSSEYRERFQR